MKSASPWPTLTIIALSLLLILGSGPAMTCDQGQAIESMRALSQAQTERLRGSPSQQQIAARMAGETASVGQLLADERYADACKRYEEIASKYGIDLAGYREQLAPLGGGAGGGAGGECDTVAASLKIRGAYVSFKDQADTSGMSPVEVQDYHRQFSAGIDRATLLVQTDPPRACEIVDEVLNEFGVK